MKRFLGKLLTFITVNVVLVAAAFVIYVKRFPPGDSLYAASIDKINLLRNQASPRLIFVGGSSMAFGMDSALVAKRCGFHPVNTGLHIGIGLEFMLGQVEPFVRAGDVVIVAPEYHAFEKYYRADPEYVARLIECSPQVLRFLSWPQVKALFNQGYVHHVGSVLRSLWGGGVGGFDQVVGEHSRRQSFNENGDQVSHHRDGVSRTVRAGSPLRFQFTESTTAYAAIDHLNQFGADCQRKGCRVFFSHPPYERRCFERYRESILQLEALLKRRLTIPMLDTAEEQTFSSEEIFDLEYHLNLAGKLRRSGMVAERLASALETAPTPRQ